MSDSLPPDSAQAPLVVGAESAVDDDAPAVVAVVVARSGDPELDVTFGSLAQQDYTNLSVLVIDGTSDGLGDRVSDVLPDAFVHRFTGTPGFAAAANRAQDLVDGGGFFLFCNDRVALDSTCVSELVEELYRSNAGIVTPKYVQWDDPRRLVAIGMGSDRFGVQVDLVEPGEFDQEQYDAVQDVFVAPEGVQLVRADLFRALGGFDESMESVSEDLDFCWRAQVAGARVVAVPDAVARLRPPRAADDTTGDKKGRKRAEDDRRRLLGRNRLRTLLVTGTRFSLIRVLPLAVLLLLAEAVYSLIAGRRRQAADALAAIGSNLGRLDEIRARRAELSALRQVSDRDLHALQVGGSARLSSFFRGQFSVGDRLVGLAASVRDSFTGDGSSSARDASLIGLFVAILMVLGSRALITDGVTPVGQFLDLPDGGVLLREWYSSWRYSGTGGPGNSPTAFLVLGLLRGAFFWADGLLDLLLVLGPLGAGALGAWRLTAPLASARASALAMLAFVGNPLLTAMFSAGRWDSLVVWAAAPWMLLALLLIQGLPPFDRNRRTHADGAGPVPSFRPHDALRFGVLVAAVATFVPVIILVAVLMVGGLLLGSLLAGRVQGTKELLLAAGTAVIVPGAVHGLWTIEVLRRFRWEWFVGTPSPEAEFDSLADILRFAPGVQGPRFLAIALLIAAFVPVLIAQSSRLEVAIRSWAMALLFFAVAWFERRGWLPMAVPSTELLLAPAAAALSLSVGAGVRSFDIDLVGYKFGWRQLVGFAGVVALAASALLLIESSLDGRWGQAEQGYGRSTELLADRIEGSSRMLWLGAPSVLPIDAHSTGMGTTFAVSDGGTADVLGRWTPEPYGSDQQIADRLDLAAEGQTARLGHLLGPYGIDVIVVVPQLAPAPYDGPTVSPGTDVEAFLSRQLDLQRVPGTPDLLVYRNVASRGPVVETVEPLPVAGDALTQLKLELATGTRAAATSDRAGSWTIGEVAADSQILLAVRAEGWRVVDDAGDDVPTTVVLGGLLAIEPDTAADQITASYPTPLSHRLALIGQAVLILVTLALSRRPRPETVG